MKNVKYTNKNKITTLKIYLQYLCIVYILLKNFEMELKFTIEIQDSKKELKM